MLSVGQSIKQAVLACAVAMSFLGVLPARAEPMHFTGHFVNHNEVFSIPFTLTEDVEDIYFWTDSFLGGLNFDPLLTLWESNGSLFAWNDNDSSISPGTQTKGDAGLYFSMLWAGDYIVTLTANENAPMGMDLSDGFFYDGQAPEPLTTDGAWSVWIGTPSVVPEPSLYLMWGVGLGALGVVASRSRAKRA